MNDLPPNVPLVDNTPIAPDPFGGADFFGSAVNKPIEDHQEEMPEDIARVMLENGLDKLKYHCILKRVPEDGVKTKMIYLSSWVNRVPVMEYVARCYGPGDYMLSFQWRTEKGTGKNNNKSDTVEFTIGEESRDLHEDYILDMQLKRNEERKAKLSRVKLRREIETGFGTVQETKGPEDIKAYVQEIASTAEALGFRRAETFPWKDILPLMLPVFLKLLDKGNSGGGETMIHTMYGKMLELTQQNNTHLLDVVKAQGGQGAGASFIKEYADMLKGTIDLKRMVNNLEQPQESAVDRVFEIIEKVAPMIVGLMAQSKQQRENSIQFKMAQTFAENSPEIAAIAKDPQALIDFVNRNDEAWGWRVTDAMLEMGKKVGLYRPVQCPHRADLELPSDQRGPATTQNETTEENLLQ
jgi:hypothetical protein